MCWVILDECVSDCLNASHRSFRAVNAAFRSLLQEVLKPTLTHTYLFHSCLSPQQVSSCMKCDQIHGYLDYREKHGAIVRTKVGVRYHEILSLSLLHQSCVTFSRFLCNVERNYGHHAGIWIRTNLSALCCCWGATCTMRQRYVTLIALNISTYLSVFRQNWMALFRVNMLMLSENSIIFLLINLILVSTATLAWN